MSDIGIIGAGSFGTALAISLAKENHKVNLWARSETQIKEMLELNENKKFLPGITFPKTLRPILDFRDLECCSIILIAIPTQSLNQFFLLHDFKFNNLPVVACCKGAELETGDLPTEIIKRYLPNNDVLVLTGPGFASELALGKPTAMSLGSDRSETNIQKMLSSKTLRLYQSDDLIGLQLGGALKNVIAIACGMVMGAGLGESARASLMTRGFAEMIRFAKEKGANPDTLMGLSGFGDLSLTCNSKKSRNFSYGFSLTSENLLSCSDTVEGIKTSHIIAQQAADLGVDMPITNMISRVLKNELTTNHAIDQLLSRPLKQEI
ncbi:MAG: glycerol-3-phosphate dehydrogenase [Rhodobacteraceae bacterium]|nr:glycerol-3-phosphate dehydrogenase [Paracoccaceae bacterium]